MKKRQILLFVLIMITVSIFTACNKEITVRNFKTKLFGNNVYIFSPDDNPKKVQAVLDKIYAEQEAAQFGKKRYALYFMPGEYDPSLHVSVGFYTHVAGLGKIPTETKINKLDSLARWLGNNPKNHNACCNFWRQVENIEIQSTTVWAVSQATSLRRVKIDGDVRFHDQGGWCSGGFSADSLFEGNSNSGSQQQWLSRNNEYFAWRGSNWNIVMMGDKRQEPLNGSWPKKAFTDIEKTPVVKEKPFLMYDENQGFGVYVPSLNTDFAGITWASELTGNFISLEKFYVARPGDSALKINKELKKGKHLFMTPGIYKLSEPIKIEKAGTVVLGAGLATIIPTCGNECMKAADEDGIIIAGILFDAGEQKSDNLLVVGEAQSKNQHKENPICLSDLYFRVGGMDTKKPTKVETCITINSSNVICDNFWVWRADHGSQVDWDLNEADYGIVVNGDDVTAYALMVEHFKKHQTVWNGNNGKIYMYQCEIPYDVPSQAEWMSHGNTKNGYASITVASDVKDFYGKGIGIYLLNRRAQVMLESAVEVPDVPGVRIENICTVMIGGYPGINHIVNESGNSVLKGVSREVLTEYCNGKAR